MWAPVNDGPLDVAPAPISAFDDVFRHHYSLLVRALSLACGDAEVAADCVQDAFVKAHARWRKISHYDNPVAWVRRVAINKMRDHFRHEARGVRVRALLAADVRPVDGPVVEGEVLAMIATLPPQQRLAMSLYYVEDLSVAEVAAAMSLSEGAVKFHMNQGRQRLRPRLVEANDA